LGSFFAAEANSRRWALHAEVALAPEGGMRERVHALGGSLQIESGPEGTRIAIRLPMKEA
jgi:glucose-6-phosphate-specific signal transduction histidine kinase